MARNFRTPNLRPERPVYIAVGTFLLLWVVFFIGLSWGRTGTMPGILMEVFEFIYIDILYQPVWVLLRTVLPASPLGYYTASTIGYVVLSLFVAGWVHVLNLARRPA
jgi:hypothetical protein